MLSGLLDAATVSPVDIDGARYELLAWGPSHARRGWLCHPPPETPVSGVPVVQQRVWAVCGGVVERFGEPLSWWNNQDEVLTQAAALVDVAAVLTDYAWLWEDDGLPIPIDPTDFYAVAVEANGNLTLAHRASGELILFAPDHDYDGVSPLAGCPPYSLMTLAGLPDLTAWIEANAKAWADSL